MCIMDIWFKRIIIVLVLHTNTGGTNENIRRRIGLARITYNKLAPVWNNSQISSTKSPKERNSVCSNPMFYLSFSMEAKFGK